MHTHLCAHTNAHTSLQCHTHDLWTIFTWKCHWDCRNDGFLSRHTAPLCFLCGDQAVPPPPACPRVMLMPQQQASHPAILQSHRAPCRWTPALTLPACPSRGAEHTRGSTSAVSATPACPPSPNVAMALQLCRPQAPPDWDGLGGKELGSFCKVWGSLLKAPSTS